MNPHHLALALSLPFLFGAGWVFGKTATEHFAPILVAALRFGIAGLVGVAIWGWPKAPLRLLLPASTCAIGVPYGLSYVGLAQLDVSVTVLLVQLEAPILILLSAATLRERPGRREASGIALAVLGALFVAGTPSAAANPVAVSFVILSMAVWAVGQVQVRRLGIEGDGPALLGALALLATPQLALTSLIVERGQARMIIEASAIVWGQVLYLGLAMTVLGIGLWYRLIALYPIHAVAPMLLLVPVVSVTGGVLWLGETLEPATAIGGILILAGVAVATLGGARGRDGDGLRASEER